MENPTQKYELQQSGKKYKLITQIYQDKLRFVCIEIDLANQIVFIGEFSILDLMNLSPIFSSISNITIAQQIFDKLITSQKVIIENQQNYINLKLLIQRDGQPDETFYIKLNMFNKGDTKKEELSYQQTNENKIYTQKELKNEFLSLISNNNEASQTINSTTNIIPGQYTLASQNQNSENITYNINGNNNQEIFNINSSPNFNTEQIIQTSQNQENQNMIFSATNNNENTQSIHSPINSNFQQFMPVTENQGTENIGFNETGQIETNQNISSPQPNFNAEQYMSSSQEQSPESGYNINGNIQNNILYNGSPNNYEKSVLYKSKRKRVDKLTLSLRAQPNLRLSEDFRIIEIDKNGNNLNQQSWDETIYSTKEQETYMQKNKPLQQNILSPNNIIENNYDSNNQIYTSELNPQIKNIPQTNIEDNEKDKIIENLRNENNQLRSQIEILRQENQNIKLKNNTNGDQSEEILFLKQENERYLKEINDLRMQLNQLNEFENYKRLKEEEISLLKRQIEELLSNQRKLEEFIESKQREIDELKLYIEELLKKKNLESSQFKFKSNQNDINKMNLEDQMLTIQDTRLEIVRGDILQNAIELEMLYKAKVDSDKAEAFHNKCDFAKSSLVLVRSANGKRFGGFTSCDWRGNNIEKKDDNAFVFSLDKMKIYDIIPGEDAIGCYPKYGPVFLGCQIRIYDECFTKGGTTFEKGLNYNTEEDYELSGGLKKFDVKDIEVYSVDFE